MKFIINGGRPLSGEVTLKGFKNSATPIIAATLLTGQPCILGNIPKIGDVLKILEILRSMGSKQRWISDDAIEIDNKDIDPDKIDQNLVNQIRSSILLIGPMLARFKKFNFITPGGCKIGSRPIDTHLEALEDLGARVNFDEDSGIYSISLESIKNNQVYLREFSVTATENLLMLGFVYPLTVSLAAIEPHVWDLVKFLKKLGVKIDNTGSHTFKIGPGKMDNSVIEHTIINDPIEADTMAILGAVTKSNISIKGIEEEYLEAPLRKLREFGVSFAVENNILRIDGRRSVLKAVKLQTMPYPGLPTDLQAPFGVLATQAQGASLIFDTMYEGRLKYIEELKKMGADAVVLDAHRAIINGPTVLHGSEIESLDLRAGATLVIAALAAEGQSVLNEVEQIDRGYERLDERLKSLGASIERIS